MDTIPKTPIKKILIIGLIIILGLVAYVYLGRDSYSILILDQANQRRLNKLGLDIRLPLDALIGDLKGAANLTRKEEYIETLTGIRKRY